MKHSTPLPVVLLAAMALVSCKTEPATTKKNTEPCSKKMQLFMKWSSELEQTFSTRPPSYAGSGAQMPTPSGQPYRANPTTGPWLGLSASELRTQSGKLPIQDATVILDLFRELHASGKKKHAESPTPFALQLLVRDDTPWSRVVAAFRTARKAGFRKVALPYRVPLQKYPQAPPHTSLDEELEQMAGKPPDPSALFQLLSGLVGNCPKAGKVLEAAIQEGSGFRAISAGLAEAIEACECHVDIPALKAALWFGFCPRIEPAIVIELAGPEQAEAITVGIPGIVPFRVAFRKLQKASSQKKPLRFEFKDKVSGGVQP